MFRIQKENVKRMTKEIIIPIKKRVMTILTKHITKKDPNTRLY